MTSKERKEDNQQLIKDMHKENTKMKAINIKQKRINKT